MFIKLWFVSWLGQKTIIKYNIQWEWKNSLKKEMSLILIQWGKNPEEASNLLIIFSSYSSSLSYLWFKGNSMKFNEDPHEEEITFFFKKVVESILKVCVVTDIAFVSLSKNIFFAQ